MIEKYSNILINYDLLNKKEIKIDEYVLFVYEGRELGKEDFKQHIQIYKLDEMINFMLTNIGRDDNVYEIKELKVYYKDVNKKDLNYEKIINNLNKIDELIENTYTDNIRYELNKLME